MATFKLLENHGRELKGRYRTEFKRHIRFDDEKKGIFLNIKIPGDTTWTRVDPSVARAYADSAQNQEAKFERMCPIPPQGSARIPPNIQGSSYRRPRALNDGASSSGTGAGQQSQAR